MISRTRWTTLVAVALGVGAVTWWLLESLRDRGTTIPEVSWLVGPVELLIAGVVLSMGWAVRQFLRGKRPTLNPIRAARTAVLAKACAYTGAMLVGWYGGQLAVRLGALDMPASAPRAWAAGLATAGALAMAVVGLVAEGFCRVPPAEPHVEVGPAAR
ncbi:DUF3180 domain-containing protein [Cellulomonas edaphi]|uniref:DUF3180 domain-containing protein n=1 Tax=Cellulomonas edaphi TaxID=3053468 RepID=A0ABT7S496_9CELL|nr:DUF3180 domain-containing protein [Cellulomons edaphi]MDM7830438.1 DUF3180 domain-containing protein [Cellulomons edaphi]